MPMLCTASVSSNQKPGSPSRTPKSSTCTSSKLPSLLCGAVLSSAALGCFGGAAAPFDTVETGNVTLLRLQNYEAQPQPTAQPGAPLPGIPPQIQQWAQQAAPVLQQLLPPGLIPPEMLQAPAMPTPAQQSQSFRFHGRLVLGTQQVLDPKLKEKLSELFGDPDNFQLEHQPCDYAEMGMGWSTGPGVAPYEVLISFSCNHVQAAQGFTWPHSTGMGMKPKMVEGLAEVIGQLFPTTVSQPPAASGPQPAALAALR